jgi:hypothetical protein
MIYGRTLVVEGKVDAIEMSQKWQWGLPVVLN